MSILLVIAENPRLTQLVCKANPGLPRKFQKPGLYQASHAGRVTRQPKSSCLAVPRVLNRLTPRERHAFGIADPPSKGEQAPEFDAPLFGSCFPGWRG